MLHPGYAAQAINTCTASGRGRHSLWRIDGDESDYCAHGAALATGTVSRSANASEAIPQTDEQALLFGGICALLGEGPGAAS